MKPRNIKSTRSAFTLIELLLVMVILAVLAAVVVPKFAGRSRDSKITAAKSGIAGMKTALEAFEVDNGRYPSNDEGLMALVQAPSGLTNWHGPYIDVQPDPWQHPWVYRIPGTYNPSGFDIFSTGEDGVEGNDDIGNWNVQQQ